jgi:hypothetical protein
MRKHYLTYFPILFLLIFAASCKKDAKVAPTVTQPGNFAKLGLYEQVSGSNRRVFIAVSQIGTRVRQITGWSLIPDQPG